MHTYIHNMHTKRTCMCASTNVTGEAGERVDLEEPHSGSGKITQNFTIRLFLLLSERNVASNRRYMRNISGELRRGCGIVKLMTCNFFSEIVRFAKNLNTIDTVVVQIPRERLS